MLGNETGGGHAGCGVYLQEVYLLSLGDDVVDADDAIAAQDVVDGGGEGLHALGQTVGDACWGDFLDLTVVLAS